MAEDLVDTATLVGAGQSDDDADRVYRTLRAAIDGLEIRPGQKLASERDLASDLRVPRAAVRRAMRQLTVEGLVERGVGRAGSRVKPGAVKAVAESPAAASPQDVLEARWAIEPGLAVLTVARATERDFAAMERHLAHMRSAATQQEFREAGYAFHLEITRATRNPLLVDVFKLIIDARARAGWGKLGYINATAEQREAQIARNAAILVALRERDGPTAARLMREHFELMLGAIRH